MNLGLSNMSNSAPIGGDRPEASETFKLADHDDTNNMHAKKNDRLTTSRILIQLLNLPFSTAHSAPGNSIHLTEQSGGIHTCMNMFGRAVCYLVAKIHPSPAM